MSRPIILLDVDGVLNPIDGVPEEPDGSLPDQWGDYTKHKITINQGSGLIERYFVYLNPIHGDWIRSFLNHADVVWCTTWEYKANAYIRPLLDLPTLPVLQMDFAKYSSHFGDPGHTKKLPHVLDEYGAFRGEPLLWIDDELYLDAELWARERNFVSPTHLIQVDPEVGLTETQYHEIMNWISELS